MIKYFQVNNKTGRTAEIYYREKANTRSKCSKETYISKRKSVLITGDGDSGKTRNLIKIWDKRADIWKKKPHILLNAITPLDEWIGTNREYLPVIKNEKQWQTVKRLIKFCADKKAVVFIDNAHKLTGRKLDIAKACASRNVVYATALSENRIPATIRQNITYNCLRFNLGTKVAYDATQGLIIIIALGAFFLGMNEIGILAGVFAMLKAGRLGSNNN